MNRIESRLQALGYLLKPGFLFFLLRQFWTSFRRLINLYQCRDAPAIDPRLIVGKQTNIGTDVRISFPPENRHASISIGCDAYIASRVVLAVVEGAALVIGDNTNINENCHLDGNVCIESNSLLAPGVFASSGDHFPAVRPTWLIKDQDELVGTAPEFESYRNKPIHVEEDCWIGYGVFLKRGVYVGRGAIIGAYSVVTKDVSPYSIHLGAPNREVGKRLEFSPPRKAYGKRTEDWPYFYCGFKQRQEEVSESITRGVLMAKKEARVVLAGGPAQQIEIEGVLGSNVKQVELNIFHNGSPIGSVSISDQVFKCKLALSDKSQMQSASSEVPPILRQYHVFTLVVHAVDGKQESGLVDFAEPAYGISSAALG